MMNTRITTISQAARKALCVAAAILLAFALCLVAGCNGNAGNADTRSAASPAASASAASSASEAALSVQEDGSYTSKDEVAAYIHKFGHLPGNFITKTAARKAGWVPSKGNLDEVCPGKSIGGSVFENYDGTLPDARGRIWKECDIGYTGGRRGAERIVFSNDGLVFYTADHYETFEQLY